MQTGETKRCDGCKKYCPIESFKLNVRTGDLTKKCSPCRDKHAKSANSSRDSKVVARQELLKAGETPDMIFCKDCGMQPYSAFEIDPGTNIPHTKCKQCRDEMRSYLVEYPHTESGEKARSKYLTSKKGIEAVQRHRKGVSERIARDPGMKLNYDLLRISQTLISRRQSESKEFTTHTSFATVQNFLDVVRSNVTSKGMSYGMHGSGWQLDHKIPREAYDFSNPEDVRRCWSAKNIHALTSADNAAKGCRLFDHYIMEAGAETFPTAWKGQIPDDDFKKQFVSKCAASKIGICASKSSSASTSTSRNLSTAHNVDTSGSKVEEYQPPPDSDSD